MPLIQATSSARVPPMAGYSARLPYLLPATQLPISRPAQPLSRISGGPSTQQRREQRRGQPVQVAALPPSAVFDAATLVVMPFYAAMVAAPSKPFTQRLLGSGPVFAAAALLYGLLLAAWNPLPQIAALVQGAAAAAQAAAAASSSGGLLAAWKAALPSMPAFAALFSSPEITVVAWVHLLLLDLFQARWVYRDGQRNGVPIWHSAILCFMVGPLGLLCHLITKQLARSWRQRGQPSQQSQKLQQEDYVIYRF